MAPRDTFNGVGVGRKAWSEAEEAVRWGHFFFRRHRAQGWSAFDRALEIDRQDYVSNFLLGFDVAGRLDDLLQRVSPVHDGAVLPGLDELLDQEDVLLRV